MNHLWLSGRGIVYVYARVQDAGNKISWYGWYVYLFQL